MGGADLKAIYLIRHCKAEGQEAAAQLTAAGREQAQQLVATLEKFHIEYVASSPYLRAMDTIRPFCDQKILPLHTDDRLVERVLSTNEYEDWIEKLALTYEDLDLTFAGGESSREAMDRGVALIHELLERPENHFAVVTHGALMSLILKYFDGAYGFEQWKSLTNPDIFRVVVNQGEAAIDRVWAPTISKS